MRTPLTLTARPHAHSALIPGCYVYKKSFSCPAPGTPMDAPQDADLYAY